MRVDESPAVEPERCYGQGVKPRHGVSLPLSTVQISLSSDGSRRTCGGFASNGELIPRRVLAASCALAALCLLRVWFCFLPTDAANRFLYEGSSSPEQFLALLMNMALFTAIFVAAWRIARPLRTTAFGERITNIAFLAFLTVPGNAIRGVLQPVTTKFDVAYWRQAPGPLKIAMLAAGLLVVLAGFGFHRHVVRVVCRGLMFVFPVVPLLFAEATWMVSHRSVLAATASPHLAGVRTQPAVRRVVWIIFDEMDYRLAFEGPTRSRLAEFNRLAEESLTASRAYSPGGRTIMSVPALLAGRMVTASRSANATDLMVRYEGSNAAIRWSTDQTIFHSAAEQGWRAGVVGWYLPYTRVFGRDIETTEDQTWPASLNPNRPFPQLVTDQWRILGEGKTRSAFGTSLGMSEHQRIFGELVPRAERKAADPNLSLVFLHMPAPHGPFYYPRPRAIGGYLDHLQLADQALGKIRRAIEEANLADSTTMIVSSDHWYREADLVDGRIDHRIPFLVHFPHDGGFSYRPPFNTVITRALITAILRGEISSAAQSASWIDRARGPVAESPYLRN
jgi:hypothetical protein